MKRRAPAPAHGRTHKGIVGVAAAVAVNLVLAAAALPRTRNAVEVTVEAAAVTVPSTKPNAGVAAEVAAEADVDAREAERRRVTAQTEAAQVQAGLDRRREAERQRASRGGGRAHAPAVAARPATRPPAGDDWARLRQCESGGDYTENTGNGFYGAYQFSASTWHSLGYGGLPHEASAVTQDEAARRLQARSGWRQWPACSRRLGL